LKLQIGSVQVRPVSSCHWCTNGQWCVCYHVCK